MFAEAGGSRAVVTRLSLGTQVRLVKTKDGWTLIARDGKAIGSVEPKTLAGLQLRERHRVAEEKGNRAGSREGTSAAA